MQSFSIVTFGCKVNYAESSSLENGLIRIGLVHVDLAHNPDLIIINSCSVTNTANYECLKTIRHIMKHNPNVKIIVTGCLSKSQQDAINEKNIIAVFDNYEKHNIISFIKSIIHTQKYDNIACDRYTFHHAYSLGSRTRTFLKIQDGCNYWCSYCIIPQTRGFSRSDTIDSIINDVKTIRDVGVKEIVITGINIGDVGLINNKRQYTFNDLLAEIDAVKDVPRIRISSLEPNFIDNEFLHIFNSSKNIVKHLHIPLQSGDDDILRHMHRRYDTALYNDKIMRIKDYNPLCCIGADVIVGFPGEEEENFIKTYELIQKLPVSYLHVFPFSPRDNTLAATMDRQIEETIKHHRVEVLRTLSQQKKLDFYNKNLDTVAEVLFEETEKDDKMYGYSDNYIRFETDYNAALINKIVRIKMNHISSKCLAHGEIINQ